jgi:hypothetical protein
MVTAEGLRLQQEVGEIRRHYVSDPAFIDKPGAVAILLNYVEYLEGRLRDAT